MIELIEKYYRLTNETATEEIGDVKIEFAINEGGLLWRTNGGNSYTIDPDDTTVKVIKEGKQIKINNKFDFKVDLIECLDVESDDTLYFLPSVEKVLNIWLKDTK